MTEFGKTLREAREAKGITISQIAETTHLLPQIVEDLENEDFHRISAPIYGRGFVKLYCEAVGIEAKPLVDEFMAILNGERAPAIRMKAVELPPEEPKAEAEEPAEAPQPVVYTQPELGEETPPPAPAPVERPVIRENASVREDARRETRDANGDARPETRDALAAPTPRQYHPDYARPAMPLPPNLGRLAILAGGALAILALLIWGGRALYRASMGISDETTVSGTAEPTTEEAAKPAKTSRTPKPVPSLYID